MANRRSFRNRVRTAVTKAVGSGRRIARRRIGRARMAHVDGEAATVAYARRLDAEFTLAQPLMEQVYDTRWWAEATPEQIGAVWQTAVSWAAVAEPYAAATLEYLREQTRFFCGVDVGDVPTTLARDVVALLARARSERGLPSGVDADTGAVGVVVRDTATGVVLDQRVGAVPASGVSAAEYGMRVMLDYRKRFAEATGADPGQRLDWRAVVEVYSGTDVTGTPLETMRGDRVVDDYARIQRRRDDIRSGAAHPGPEGLRDALLVEKQRLVGLAADHEADGRGEEAARIGAEVDYLTLRIAAAEAELRGEDGVHVFQQAALRGRFGDQWWPEASADEVAVLWGYVAGWSEGWAKLSMTAHMHDRVHEHFGVVLPAEATGDQVRSLLAVMRSPVERARPEQSPDAASGVVSTAVSSQGDRPSSPATEPKQPEATREVDRLDPLGSGRDTNDAVAEPPTLPNVGLLDEDQIVGVLRRIDADEVATTLPGVFEVIAAGPGEDTWYVDVDRAVEAFQEFRGATEEALVGLSGDEDANGVSPWWWLLELEDELATRALRAGHPSYDHAGLVARAEYASLSDERLQQIRDSVNENTDGYDLLVEMLERRGYDEFGEPGHGSPIGLGDPRPFDPSMDGAHVRANLGGGRVIDGVINRHRQDDWWIDGHDDAGRPEQLWLRPDAWRGPPHVQFLPDPAVAAETAPSPNPEVVQRPEGLYAQGRLPVESTAGGDPAGSGQEPSTVGGVLIEHHARGTLVYGTSKSDLPLRDALHRNDFRWSNNTGAAGAWYQRRQTNYDTRDQRVRALIRELENMGRAFEMREEEPGDAVALAPITAGQAYATRREIAADVNRGQASQREAADTSAGKRMLGSVFGAGKGGRGDAKELVLAAHAVDSEDFTGGREEIVQRFTRWAQAARRLTDHLAAERYRAPKFCGHLDRLVQQAEELASRLVGTAEDADRWAALFAAPDGPAEGAASTETAAQTSTRDVEPAAEAVEATGHAEGFPAEVNRCRRGHRFYPNTSDRAKIPGLYRTQNQDFGDIVVHLHYFASIGDWYIAEIDPNDGLAFGYARMAAMPATAEWGYIDLTELEQTTSPPGGDGAGGLTLPVIVERDLHWKPCPAHEGIKEYQETDRAVTAAPPSVKTEEHDRSAASPDRRRETSVAAAAAKGFPTSASRRLNASGSGHGTEGAPAARPRGREPDQVER